MRQGSIYTRLFLAACAVALCLAGWSSISIRQRNTAPSASAPTESAQTLARRTRDELMAKGRDLLDSHDFAGAIAALDRVLELSPLDAEALALQVRAFRARRQYGPAKAAAGRILETFPLSPLAHVLMGSIAVQEGDATAARKALTRALELDTSAALSAAQLASLDLMEGKVGDARRRATQSLALDPGGATALRILLKITRSVPEMMALSDRLLASNPEDELTRSWVEVLRRTRAPEVNYLAPVSGVELIACERDADGRLFVRADAYPARDLRFLIDTGASGLVLSEKKARQMGLALREFSWSAGVGGRRRHSHPILLPRFEIAGLRAREILATASDLPEGIDGIINPLVFTPAGSGLTLGLRAADSSLIVAKQRLSPATIGRPRPGGWITVPFLAENHRVIFRIVLAGAPAMALLDTGAAADIVDRSVLPRAPGVSIHEEAAGTMLVGFGGPMDQAAVDGEIPLRIAGADLPGRRFFAVDLNTEPFRFQVDLDAIIGIGSLGAFDLTIDTTAGLLAFRRVP